MNDIIVIKRTGEEVPFDKAKIISAIKKAAEASGEFVLSLTHAANVQLSLVTSKKDKVSIEEIQNLVEFDLLSHDQIATARKYIAYRERHRQLREMKAEVIHIADTVNEYLDQSDWRVKANANQGYSLGGLILGVSGKAIANYWLNNVYEKEAGDAHRSGDIHIHDLDMLSGYCAGWSLKMLLEEGLNGIPGKTDALPPKHMSAAIGQIVNFLGTLQNEWAGAQAFSSFDTYMAPFVRIDKLTYTQVKQHIQELIYNLNVPSRWGTQTPFTNLTFDWTCPEDLKDKKPVIAGKEQDFSYGSCQTEMDIINQAYIEVMTEGDAKGRIFTFPIPTYNITKDFNWNSPNADLLFGMTAKYGLPYFQNFINSDLTPDMVRSMCCRLQLDLNQLKMRGNGLFGSSEQTGSIGVVTINCARLGYDYAGDYTEIYSKLMQLIDVAVATLEVKRKVIQRHMDAGLFPYTKRYLGTLRNHFSTIGVNGINEMIKNFWLGKKDITTPTGFNMAKTVLSDIRAKLIEVQEQTGNMYNLEATPAEGATYRFAREDKKTRPNMFQAGTSEAPFYTNSSQLPVGYTSDPFAAMEQQEELQSLYTGGTVMHLYLGERIESAEACKNLVKRSLTQFHLPYLTITPTFSVCPEHGYQNGEQEVCPICGAESEVWTRVMGYHRPVTSFNNGKKAEYDERLCFIH